MTPPGTVYIIAAASGTGKTSLAKALVKILPNIKISISHTTRPRRPGEKNNLHYFFVNEETFTKMINADKFLEYAKVFNHYYGTSQEFVEKELQKGKDILLDIDWQGAQQIREKIKNCVSIFLLPPSKKALRERLEKRKRDPKEIIEQRLNLASKEISHCNEFDYIIINNDFNKALHDLKDIILTQRLKTARQTIKYAKLIEELL
jgi:guanylate kinase